MIKMLRYINKYHLRIQGIVLWITAFYFINTGSFWFFAIPAILSTGMQDILDEIRKLNKTEEHGTEND